MLDSVLDNHNSLLSLFWNEAIVNKQLQQESCCMMISKKALQLLAGAMGFAARVPAINIARKFGGDNEAWGWTLASVNVIAYGSLISWSFVKIVNDEVKAHSRVEELILQQRKAAFGKATKTALWCVGLFSQVPFGYLAYAYNPPDSRIAMAVMIIVADASFPTYSLNLSVKKIVELFRRKKLGEDARRLSESKDEMVKFLEKLRKKIPNMQEHLTPLLNQSKSKWWLCGELPLTAFGYLATGVRLTVLSVLAYKGTNLLCGVKEDEDPQKNELAFGVSVGVATMVWLVNAYLVKDVIVTSSHKLLQSAVSLFSKNTERSLAVAIQPKLTRMLEFVALGLSALSFSTPMQVAEDTFSNEYQVGDTKIYGIKTLMEVGSTAAVIILVSHSLNSLVNELVESYILVKGSEEEKNVLRLDRCLKRFIQVLDQSSLQEYAKFLQDIKAHQSVVDDPILNLIQQDLRVWVDKLNITSEQLSDYTQTAV